MSRMSKATRRQLLTCDMIQGVIDATLPSFASAGQVIPTHVERLLLKLQAYQEQASSFACARVDTNGKWQLDSQETKQYARDLQDLHDAVITRYGERVNVIDYIKATQVWAEDLRTSLPVYPVDRRIVWRDIVQTLQELYLTYDPEWAADELIDQGMESGEFFKKAVNCW